MPLPDNRSLPGHGAHRSAATRQRSGPFAGMGPPQLTQLVDARRRTATSGSMKSNTTATGCMRGSTTARCSC